MAVSQTQQETGFIIKNMLTSPPVMALSIAGVLSFWDFHAFEHNPVLTGIYAANKVLVTFSGMCILGMWLSAVKIGWADLKLSLVLILSRSVIALFLCILAYFILPIPHQQLTYAIIFMFFLLPPAANIVALETHYQGTGISAKYIASGTLASAIIISIYGALLHLMIPTL